MIIWGETANPFVLSLQPQYLEQLLQAVPAGGYLVTGALDYVYDGEKWRPLNAMQALDGKGSPPPTANRIWCLSANMSLCGSTCRKA